MILNEKNIFTMMFQIKKNCTWCKTGQSDCGSTGDHIT